MIRHDFKQLSKTYYPLLTLKEKIINDNDELYIKFKSSNDADEKRTYKIQMKLNKITESFVENSISIIKNEFDKIEKEYGVETRKLMWQRYVECKKQSEVMSQAYIHPRQQSRVIQKVFNENI